MYSLILAVWFQRGESLCLDPPYSSFVNTLFHMVQVEENQIDFRAVEEIQTCESTDGPFCQVIYSSLPHARRFELDGETLHRTLGIPKEIAISLSGNERGHIPNRVGGNFVSTNMIPEEGRDHSIFRFVRRLDLFSKGEPLIWSGEWFRDGEKTFFTFPSNSHLTASISFREPTVLQRIRTSPIKSESPIFLIGRLGGREQWRRELSSNTSLVGHQVFAKWRGNGSVHRATVMFDEGPEGGVFVSWKDGDQSFRSIARSDIMSVIQGHPQHTRAVDEIVFMGTESESMYFLSEFVVSKGPGAHNHVSVIRSGGGLVFEEDVSPASLMYTANDMMRLNLRIKDGDQTGSSKFGVLLAEAFRHPQPMAISEEFLGNRKSLRNFVSFLSYAGTTASGISFSKSIMAESVSKYLNLNDMFNAYLDSAGQRGDMILTAWDLRFQSFLTQVRHEQPAKGLTVSVGDSFKSELVCSNNRGRKQVSLTVQDMQRLSQQVSIVRLVLSVGNEQQSIDAEFFHSLSLLYIPGKWAMSVVVMRVESLSLIELVGSMELVGCGGIVLSPTVLSPTTKAVADGHVVFGETVTEAKRIISKFNAILIDLPITSPSSSAGVTNPFR